MDQPEQKKIQIKFLSEFKELFNKFWRFIVFYGGRYSGKSYHVALALLIRGRQEKLRILCTREIQNSIKDSVHKLLSDIIETFELNDYTVTKESIVNTREDSPGFGTEFIFKGLRQNTNEIKSTEGIDICWIEEAQSVSKQSLDVLGPTIRKEGSQIIVTFNRLNELDPVFVELVLNKPDRTYVGKVNYDVLERVGLLTDAIRVEMDKDREDPDLWAHKWLGEPMSQADFSIMPRSEILEAMRREVEPEGKIELGCDIARYGGDRIVLWKVKGVKTLEYKVYQKLSTPQTCDLIEEFIRDDLNKILQEENEKRKPDQQLSFDDIKGKILIKVDDTGVGGGVTDELRKRGYNVVGINFGERAEDPDKYPNLISEAWFYLKSILKEVQLPNDSDLLMELSTRQWKMTTKGQRAVEGKNEYKKRGFRSPDLADACIIAYYKKNLIQSDDIDFV